MLSACCHHQTNHAMEIATTVLRHIQIKTHLIGNHLQEAVLDRYHLELTTMQIATMFKIYSSKYHKSIWCRFVQQSFVSL